MVTIDQLIRRIIDLRGQGTHITLLAVCPNSDAVLEAAVRVAADNNMPLLFAATLNQVDLDGGYTGWTPRTFVGRMEELAARYHCTSPLVPCLDHGGPWLKDAHTRDRLSLTKTMDAVKDSLTACLEAGYGLLHIDPTVDRTLPAGEPPPVEVVVGRTVELIAYAESERERLARPPVSYEVGTEEVHGGLVDLQVFDQFLAGLRAGLDAAGVGRAWPCLIVGRVGTDLHTTAFDPESARRLYDRVAPLGSLIKGHYTDWVENPADYPATGMGGANVGPEFTAAELDALHELCEHEPRTLPGSGRPPSGFREALRAAVVDSDRWRKWLLPDEVGQRFDELTPSRQEWLVATGARYVWTEPRVLAARRVLYRNLQDRASGKLADPHNHVIQRVAHNIQRYVDAFNLRGSLPLLTG
jgi:D-tagatose-1,6-bisphosphate aldolase subunit GatZ/KbaZ